MARNEPKGNLAATEHFQHGCSGQPSCLHWLSGLFWCTLSHKKDVQTVQQTLPTCIPRQGAKARSSPSNGMDGLALRSLPGGRDGNTCLGLGAEALSSPWKAEFLLPVSCMELRPLLMVVPLSVGMLVSERLDELAWDDRPPGKNLRYHAGLSSTMGCTMSHMPTQSHQSSPCCRPVTQALSQSHYWSCVICVTEIESCVLGRQPRKCMRWR